MRARALPPAVAAYCVDPCGNSRCGTYKHAAGAGFDNRRFDGQVAASSMECYLRLVLICLPLDGRLFYSVCDISLTLHLATSIVQHESGIQSRYCTVPSCVIARALTCIGNTQTYELGATVNHGGSRADVIPSTDRQGVRKVETMKKQPEFPHPDRRFGYDHLTSKMRPVPQSTLTQSMGPGYQSRQNELDTELLARFVRSGPLYIMPANVERRNTTNPWR